MMHQGILSEPLSVLAYRSVATTGQTGADLERLSITARVRNRMEGVTGVLISDHGRYFQWLEGPASAVSRIWNSIAHDPRHRDIDVLRNEPVGSRVFDGWDLRMSAGARVSVDAAVAAVQSPGELLDKFIDRPKLVVDLTWDELFGSIVIPRLRSVHGREEHTLAGRASSASIWHAQRGCGARLAGYLLACDLDDTARFVDSLLDQGAGLNALCREVFEPAQRQLGQWSNEDRCDDSLLAMALASLEFEIRRIDAAFPVAHVHKPGHSVLLCAQPREPHHVGIALSSAMFDHDGWDVLCRYPGDDAAMEDLVRSNWFDVLQLSQSGSLLRSSRLSALRATVAAARRASRNPALIVMVDGLTFSERPQSARAVDANASSASAIDAVPLAERLLQARLSRLANYEVSAA